MRILLVLSLGVVATSAPVGRDGTNSAASLRPRRTATCARLHQQCGGRGWRGATTCDAESTCTRSSRWWSQCTVLPGLNLWQSCSNDAG